MNTAAYNDYVLSTCVQMQWITSEQEQQVRTAIAHLPGASALELLYEQQIISQEIYQAIFDAIKQSGEQTTPQRTTQTSHAASLHVEAAAASNYRFKSIAEYLKYASEHHASDVHISPGAVPKMRVNGTLRPLYEGAVVLPHEETERLARGFLDEKHLERVEELGAVDFSYSLEGMGRYRVSVARQRRGWESVFRIIDPRIRSMEELGLPDIMYTLTRYHNGLILITGAAGSGKSTTLAAMVDHINKERRDHIITMEEPVEYVFTPQGCQVSQREIHSHTESFATALRASLREDPDVIMVGEMRDLETISLAITASETGHLVLGTLHTSTAPRTLDRLLDVFPVEQQAQIRTMVSESIRGIICQQLIPRADGQGRALALEIMTNSAAIASLIRESKTYMLPGIMQTSKKQGMKLMDESLQELVSGGVITPEEGYLRADNKRAFAQFLAGAGR